MSNPDQLRILEKLCMDFYNATASEQRAEAEKILDISFPSFSDNSNIRPANGEVAASPRTPTESAYALQIFLDHSPSPYAQMFALTKLTAIVTDHFSVFPAEFKTSLRNFMLTYAGRHPDLSHFIINSIAKLFAMLTKLGWFDADDFRNVNEDLSKFLQATIEHRIVGLQILSVVVQEINQPLPPRNLARHRKTGMPKRDMVLFRFEIWLVHCTQSHSLFAAIAFRDLQLLDIFKTGYNILRELLNRQVPFNKPEQENRMKTMVLTLLRNCLTFDFIGTTPDESGEDVGSIQVPSSWKAVFEDGTLLQTIFDCYREFGSPHSAMVMECLVQIASVRRSLFNEEERSKFIVAMMTGIRDILLVSQGMDDPNNYHEFCRMLARFRSTYQLNEIAEKTNYVEWIELVAEFSIKGFQAWQWAPNSTQYLLTFWSKMVSALSHARPASAGKLETITIEVGNKDGSANGLTKAYTSSRVASVQPTLEQASEVSLTRVYGSFINSDPLENEEALLESLEMLANVARCKYDDSVACVISIFDPIAVQYQELVARATSTGLDANLKNSFQISEQKFAWLVYIIGAFIGGRTAYMSSDDVDNLDGDLTAKVLHLMNINQVYLSQRGPSGGSEKLESAFLFFFQQFRKSYIGDTSHKSSVVYSKLSEAFGLSDQNMVLSLIVNKIMTNLTFWGQSPSVITKSLRLFNDLASGYSSVKQLRKLDSTQYIMQNHASKQFSFLENSDNSASRMVYYSSLSKVLFAEDSGEREFYEFMKPFEVTFDKLATLPSIEAFRQEPVKRILQEVFKDLRGFINPVQTKKNYMVFFDWFYPDRMPVLIHGLEAWGNDRLAITLLKFFAELVHNKGQRLNFEISSPNGILLFRETSKVLTTYGRILLNRPATTINDKYTDKYKGISVCFSILTRALSGRYVNFGVFPLYGDKALDHALEIFFQMMLSIPLDDMMVRMFSMAFPKLTRTFFSALDVFTNEHMMVMPSMNAEVFLYLMRALAEGIKSVDINICSQACSCIDHLCTFVVQQSEKERPSPHWLLSFLNNSPGVLPLLFSTVFNTVLFEDRSIQWSLSRPLLGLMLLNREFMLEYTQTVINSQLPERREFLHKSLGTLMEEVEWTNLSAKNRDRFTQNLANFRRELNSASLSLILPAVEYGTGMFGL
ncbi:Exportin-7-B [Endogone sp. FLAS-F59071]|nr:Exportin-7-B [Endogone sp. FLAS-F59071]|eukprot:RUS20332.1 Exportin-7-B [Endogone sp. FLAS-F59071]